MINHDDDDDDNNKGEGPVLLTWVRLVTRSALQSRKWQLIGMR